MNYQRRKLLTVLPVIALLAAAAGGEDKKESPKKETQMKSVYDFKAADIDGNDVNLADYKGKVLLIVNVASKCGFTPQYKGLESIYRQYKDKGFEILGFPSNDFMGQEPGTNEEIKSSASSTTTSVFRYFRKYPSRARIFIRCISFLRKKAPTPNSRAA